MAGEEFSSVKARKMRQKVALKDQLVTKATEPPK